MKRLHVHVARRALEIRARDVGRPRGRVAALEDTAKELPPGNHPILPCNLSNHDAVDKLVPSAEVALGGLDIEMPAPVHFGAQLSDAVLAGKVPESVVDEAATRIVRNL